MAGINRREMERNGPIRGSTGVPSRPQETLEHPPELSIRLPTRVSWSRLITLIASTARELQFRIDGSRD